MKKILVAALFVFGSTAFADGSTMPSCQDLVQNTAGIVTLTPITSASNPIQAGENVVFAAATEGVDLGFCVARVTIEAGKIVIIGLEDVMQAGKCVLEGAADLLAALFGSIFGQPSN